MSLYSLNGLYGTDFAGKFYTGENLNLRTRQQNRAVNGLDLSRRRHNGVATANTTDNLSFYNILSGLTNQNTLSTQNVISNALAGNNYGMGFCPCAWNSMLGQSVIAQSLYGNSQTGQSMLGQSNALALWQYLYGSTGLNG